MFHVEHWRDQHCVQSALLVLSPRDLLSLSGGRNMERKRPGRDTQGENGVALATSEVPVERIQQNPYQPRKSFDPDELACLSASVRAHGVLQPLVVRAVGDQFQLIAGERRLR